MVKIINNKTATAPSADAYPRLGAPVHGQWLKTKSIKMLAATRIEPGRPAYEASALYITPPVH